MSKLLMFDFDGVIVDSLDHFASRFLRGCCQLGIESVQTQEDVLNLFDGNIYDRMDAIGIGAKEIVQILGTVEEGAQATVEEVHVFPAMHTTLARLAEQFPLVLISSNVTKIVTTYLEAVGLTCFTEVLGGDVETSKQRKIITTLERYPDHIAYYIGDTTGDMQEGRAAGVRTIGVGWGWHSPDRLLRESPDHLVATPDDLLSLLV